ncbi:TlpA family protein disulfide reductase [Streptomyces sp. NPDC048638]|uniref:TlpA family protein disulfide reductase n=1 Tax=Streptomyces sp. NPDC048638 TaxID=3365580 RepID=UPI00371E90CB
MSARPASARPSVRPRTALLTTPLATALAVAGAVALTACDSGTSDGRADRPAGFVQGKDGTATVPAADRTRAPDLSGSTTRGASLDVSRYRGGVVVLNVWSSTCGPCIAEAPALAKVARSTRSKGVRFVGINTGDTGTTQATSFEKQHAMPYPSLFDPAGKLLLRFPKGVLNPQFVPATIVLDKQGRPAARAIGSVGEDTLRAMIAPLLKEK